ncbi:hypothetical protein QTP88_009029 [Uroleucon formosanum]
MLDGDIGAERADQIGFKILNHSSIHRALKMIAMVLPEDSGESSDEDIIEKVESPLPSEAIEEDLDELLREIELNPLDELWGTAKPSNTKKIQAFQSIYLRLLSSAPWYITNNNLHKDLKVQTLNQTAKMYYARFHNKLQSRTNPLIIKLSTKTLSDNPQRRLKRKWCRDLLS